MLIVVSTLPSLTAKIALRSCDSLATSIVQAGEDESTGERQVPSSKPAVDIRRGRRTLVAKR
jgi:hypothetical protein